MSIQYVFADNMRKYRKIADMTQEGLAEASGLHRTYIGGIEQHRINVSLKNVEKIANALGVDPALLFMHEKNADAIKKHEMRDLPQPPLQANEYALCTWTENGVEFQQIDVQDEDIAVHILCTLIQEGFEGDGLIREFDRAQREILATFKKGREAL